jgi:hypothetical protein
MVNIALPQSPGDREFRGFFRAIGRALAYNCADRLERFERLLGHVGFDVRTGESPPTAPIDA